MQFLEPTSTLYQYAREWISKVSRLDPIRRSEIPDYPFALVIGLGKTGYNVLSQIKENLAERHFGNVPRSIKFLQIGATGTIESDSFPLTNDEKVQLQSDRGNLDYSDLSQKRYFDWLQEMRNQPSARAIERANFFVSLQSREQSALYRALQKSVSGNHRAPQVFMVANLDEPESSVIWDLAFLLRYKVTEGWGVGMNAARFAAFVAVDSGEFPFEMNDDTFAPLRELSRVMLNGFTRFIYPAPDLSGVAENALVDMCFLVDKKSGGEPIVDLSDESGSEGVSRAISEALTVLISPAPELQDAFQKSSEKTSNARDRYQQAFVSGLGIATIVFPVAECSRAIELRLLRTVFFGGDSFHSLEGMVPVPWNLSTSSHLFGSDIQKMVQEFLRIDLAGANPSASPILDLILLNKTDGISSLVWPPGLDDLFKTKLSEWITRELNGHGASPFVCRSNRLPTMLEAISAITHVIEQAQLTTERLGRSRVAIANIIRVHLDNWLSVITQSGSELKGWYEALTGKRFGENTTRSRRGAHMTRTDDKNSLLQMIERDWFHSREALSLRTKSKIRRAPLEDGKNEPPYDGLEKPLFIRYIRPELSGAVTKGDVLDKVSARIGWYCSCVNDFRIYLLVCPPEYSRENLSSLSPDIVGSFFYSREQMKEAYSRLLVLSTYYSRKVLDEQIGYFLQAETLSRAVEFLEGAQNPLLPYLSANAPEDRDGHLAQLNQHFLISTDSGLAEKIKTEPSLHSPRFVPTNFGIASEQSVTLVSFHHVMALEATQAYQRSKAGYSFQAGSHIFIAEQYASRVENELRNILDEPFLLHPQFVRLFELGSTIGTESPRYTPLANLFLRGWLYKMICYDPNLKSWRVPSMNEFDEILVKIPGTALLEAVQEFSLNMPCSSSLHNSHPLAQNNLSSYARALHEMLGDLSKSSREQTKARLNEIDKTEIKGLLEQPDPLKRSLGAYLKYMVEEERYGEF
jgi:hypothetical protein